MTWVIYVACLAPSVQKGLQNSALIATKSFSHCESNDLTQPWRNYVVFGMIRHELVKVYLIQKC